MLHTTVFFHAGTITVKAERSIPHIIQYIDRKSDGTKNPYATHEKTPANKRRAFRVSFPQLFDWECRRESVVRGYMVYWTGGELNVVEVARAAVTTDKEEAKRGGGGGPF